MKKLYSLFIILFAVLQPITAQDAFYVYRNDGQFNTFRYDMVDSMKYSKVGIDQVIHEDFVVQEVYTSDSLYQIPLSVIDSIGFSTPKTIYSEDVMHLSGEILDYVIMADAEKLCVTFSANTPTRLLPNVGEKIAALELTDKNPFGFVGKVTDVTTAEQNIIVNCSQLELEDVVDRFYGIAQIITQSSIENNTVEHVNKRVPVSSETKSFTLDIKKYLPKTIDLSDLPIYKKEDVNGVSAGASITIDMESPLVGGYVSRVIDKNLFLSYANLFLTAAGRTVTDVQLIGSIGAGIRPAIDIPIPIYGVRIIGISLGARLEASAQFSFMYTVKSDFDRCVDITYYPYRPYVFNFNPMITSHSTDKKPIPSYEWKNISLDGELSFTPFFDFGILFGDHKIGWAGVEIEAGVKVDANISFTAEHLREASFKTAFYDFLRDRKIGIEGFGRAGLTLQLSKTSWWDDYEFKPSAKLTWPIGERKEWWFLPQFNETKAYRPLPNWNAIEAIPNPYSEHLWAYTIGVELHDDEGRKIDTRYYGDDQKYREPKDTPQAPLFFNRNIQRDDNYKVYPTFKLFGFNVLASPVSEVGVTIPVTISSVTTTAAQYRPKDHPLHFSYTDKSKEQSEDSEKNEEVYEFKYNVTTAVELADDESVENWGYVYEDKKGKKSRISLKGAPYTYEDKRFVYYRNGDPRTHVAKLYPFVKYTNDEQYYYGMPVDYPLVYPETSTIELTACSTPEIVTKQNVQYNGVTYDYCSTFIFDYDATGAYWLSVGAYEFGSGWNNWDANLPKREQAKVADGSNRLTLNYYYNRKVLEGDYMIRLKGTDNTHESGGCISSDYVRLIHNGQVFTGCELKTK